MKVDWSLDEFEAEKFVKSMMRRARVVLTETAKQIPIDLTTRMLQRVTFEGTAQHANDPDTAEQKRKERGHDIPLVDEGILSDPTRWVITKPNPNRRRVKPPPERAHVIPYLVQQNYLVLGVSDEIREFMRQRLEKITANLQRDMRRYVKRRAKGGD